MATCKHSLLGSGTPDVGESGWVWGGVGVVKPSVVTPSWFDAVTVLMLQSLPADDYLHSCWAVPKPVCSFPCCSAGRHCVLRFVDGMGCPLDQRLQWIQMYICYSDKHKSSWINILMLFLFSVCGTLSVGALVSEHSTKNFKTNDLLFIMEKLDFFPLPDCQGSFV